MAGGPWNNTRGHSLCLQVGLGTTHGAAVFVCRWVLLWGGPWNNTRGGSVCLQVGVAVWGGPWNNTRGRSLCLQVKHKVKYKALSCFVRLAI